MSVESSSTVRPNPPQQFRQCYDATAVAALYGPLDGRVYFVTGGSSGFGLEQCLALARHGATVIMACRPCSKAEEAAKQVRAVSVRNAAVHLLPLDLSSTKSIRECAKLYEALRPQLPHAGLNAFVANAGVLGLPFGAFSADQEPQLQVNFLGHVLLHEYLRNALEACSDARVVVVASGSHYWLRGPPDLDLSKELPPRPENYSPAHAYGFSNLCRLLWTRAISKTVKYPVVSLHPACSPGTDAGRNLGICALLDVLPKVFFYEWRGFLDAQSVAQGARTQTFVAVAPLEEITPLSGKFLSGNPSDGPLGAPVTPSAFAQRDDYAQAVLQFANEFIAKAKAKAEEVE